MVEDQKVEVRDDRPLWRRCCDVDYLLYTWEGRLKIVELLATILSLICVASTGESIANAAKLEFFIVVGTTCMIFIFIHIFLRITHIYEKLPLILICTRTRAILCAVGVVFLLISSSIVVADTSVGSLIAGGVFGFFNMFVFFFEGLYSFHLHRKGVREAQRNTKPSTANEEEPYVDPASAPY